MKHTTRLLALMLALMMLVGCLAACGDSSKPNTDILADSEVEDILGDNTQATQLGSTEIAPETSAAESTTLPLVESTTPSESTTTQAPVQSQTQGTVITTVAPTTSATQAPVTSGTTSAVVTTTTTQVTTTVSSKHVMTYTTQATTTEATTAAPKNPLRVLSIGHSFSKDAMEKYLWDLLESSGKYDYIVIAYLFYPGCSLDRQWDHISGRQGVDENGNAYEYQQYRKTDPYTGQWQTCYKEDGFKNLAEYAIKDEAWDVITLQPSPDYGAGPEKCKGNNDYADVGNILNWINSRKINKNAKIMYHMTWAFAEDCRLWSFQFSNNDQLTMYKDFVAATKKYIFDAHPGKFASIIPAGTSIQNARSSKLGDVFNMPGNYDPNGDGYHLNDRGDFVAALTWYCVLTGNNAKKAKCPDEWKDEFDIFVEAVNAAIKKPYEVTQSSHKK